MRRKFADALKLLPQSARAESQAAIGVKYCDALFKLEKKYDEEKLTHEERKNRRELESEPLADEFFAWVETLLHGASYKTALGKAIIYAANQKKWLRNFLKDGRLELSNNRAGRSIRPFAHSLSTERIGCFLVPPRAQMQAQLSIQ